MSRDKSSTRRTTDGLLGAAAIVGGVALVVAIRDLPAFDRTGPGPALAPALVGVALAVCGAALMVTSRGIAPVRVRWDPADKRIAVTLALLLLAALAIDRIGLAPTAALVVLASARLAGSGLVAAVAMALAVGMALAATSAVFGMPLS